MGAVSSTELTIQLKMTWIARGMAGTNPAPTRAPTLRARWRALPAI